jgi:hypothetical protein
LLSHLVVGLMFFLLAVAVEDGLFLMAEAAEAAVVFHSGLFTWRLERTR